MGSILLCVAACRAAQAAEPKGEYGFEEKTFGLRLQHLDSEIPLVEL